MLFEYWTDVNPSVWIVLSILLTFIIGIALVRVYGEVEFWFALLKILFILFLIIFGLVIALGGVPGVPRRGFHYWNKPGAFVEFVATGSWGQFLGYWAVMNAAVFSFAGVESVAMAAAETRNPRQAIPKACKRVFWRVAIFYVLSVLIVGMLVPSNDKRLNNYSGTATQSPFVIAASDAGISGIPSLVNAIVITSAWSSSNQALLAGTPCALRARSKETSSSDSSPNDIVGHTLRLRPCANGIYVPVLHELEQRCLDCILVVC